jgi:hypothetical protein
MLASMSVRFWRLVRASSYVDLLESSVASCYVSDHVSGNFVEGCRVVLIGEEVVELKERRGVNIQFVLERDINGALEPVFGPCRDLLLHLLEVGLEFDELVRDADEMKSTGVELGGIDLDASRIVVQSDLRGAQVLLGDENGDDAEDDESAAEDS